MTDKRGTFRLHNVRQKILDDTYIPYQNIFNLDNSVGYIQDTSSTTLIRTNSETEITTDVPAITTIPKFCSGSSCETHALFAAGGVDKTSSTPLSDVHKVTFSTETSQNLPGSKIPPAKTMSVAVASGDNAYVTGGYYAGGSPGGGPTSQTGTCKISFATDSVTNLPSANQSGQWEQNSLTNGNDAGYIFGGTWIPGWANTGSRCYKITYSNDSMTLLPGSYTVWNTLETNRNPEYSRANMMSRTAGYQTGGDSFPGSDASSMTTKLTFSGESWSVVPGAYLPNPREKAASATSNRGKGWHGGGRGPSGSFATDFNLLTFSSETWNNAPGMNHPGPTGRVQESGNSSTGPFDSLKGSDKAISDNGYNGGKQKRWYDDAAWSTYGGGSGVTFDGNGDYLTTSSSSDYAMGTGDYTVECWVRINSGNNNYGIFQGGGLNTSYLTGPTLFYYVGSGLSFGNGAEQGSNTHPTDDQWFHVALVKNGSNTTLYYNGTGVKTVSDSHNYTNQSFALGGYYSTSYLGAISISNFRVVKGTAVYTENFTASGPLTNISGTVLLCCQSDSSVTAATVSSGTITSAGDPTVFTDDTTLPINKAPIPTPTSPTSLSGPQGIKNEGYLIQGIQGSTGSPGRSDVYRLDYSTETWDSSVFANSTLTRRRGGAASTTTNTYIGGGGITDFAGSPTGGDMDKLTYSTSTMSRMPGSDAGRIPARGDDGQPAAGNQTLGYWGGGYGPSGAGRSHIDKFIYSSETGASLPNFPWAQGNLGVAASIQTHAYLGGGPDEAGTNFVKITFSNDTYSSKSGWTKTPGGPATYRGATSSPTKAYIVGGLNLERQMDVTTWSNDTTSSSPSTFLASPGFSYAPGQGSNEAGYFTGGGNTGNNGTTTEKITFATDTSYVVPSAYFNSSSPAGINSYTTGGPNMNGVGTNSPNVI